MASGRVGGETASPPRAGSLAEVGTVSGVELRRGGKRASVFVGDNCELDLPACLVVTRSLEVGTAILPGELLAAGVAEDRRRARECALRYLGARDRTREEVRRRLAHEAIPGEIAEEVISDLAEGGLLDDGAFSAAWAQSRGLRRAVGPRRVVAELQQRGVARAHIEEAILQAGLANPETEAELAVRAGERRARQLRVDARVVPEAARRLLAASLARRGFSWSACRRAVDRLLGPGNDE